MRGKNLSGIKHSSIEASEKSAADDVCGVALDLLRQHW